MRVAVIGNGDSHETIKQLIDEIPIHDACDFASYEVIMIDSLTEKFKSMEIDFINSQMKTLELIKSIKKMRGPKTEKDNWKAIQKLHGRKVK